MSRTNKENRSSNRQIKFRVNDSEYQKLEQTASSFNMSVPAFAKKRAMGYRMRPPKIDKVGAIEIAKQLNMIGSNVNQIAKQLNINHQQIDSNEIKDLQNTFNEILEVFKELIR